MHSGRCECGAVRFHFDTPIGDFSACHCSQCRRLSGVYWSGFHVPSAAMVFDQSAGLTWYAASDWAKRGFCNTCGSSLFYKLNDGDGFEVAPGCIDGEVGRKISYHICVADKGDYYDITDGLPQYQEFPPR